MIEPLSYELAEEVVRFLGFALCIMYAFNLGIKVCYERHVGDSRLSAIRARKESHGD